MQDRLRCLLLSLDQMTLLAHLWYIVHSVCPLSESLLTALIVFCICTSGSIWDGCHGPLGAHSSFGGHLWFRSAVGTLSVCVSTVLRGECAVSRLCFSFEFTAGAVALSQVRVKTSPLRGSSYPLKFFIIKDVPS